MKIKSNIKQILEKVTSSEKFTQLLTDLAHLPHLVVDVDFTITYVLPSALIEK